MSDDTVNINVSMGGCMIVKDDDDETYTVLIGVQKLTLEEARAIVSELKDPVQAAHRKAVEHRLTEFDPLVTEGHTVQ